MTITVTIDEPLASQLRRLAEERGVAPDVLGREALVTGLLALEPHFDPTKVIDLGPLHPTPLTPGQSFRMHSPLVASQPVPLMKLEIVKLPAPPHDHAY